MKDEALNFYIYSDTTRSFLSRVQGLAKEIITQEMNLQWMRKRILINDTYYPLNFVVFESNKMLGLYDPKLYQIGIHKLFSYKYDNEVLKNVLRHELAHFYVHIFHGIYAQAHGPEFREVFKKFNWATSFSKAQIDLEKQQKNDSAILQKVEKLLSLADSCNENEAMLATKKANDLILKHNISFVDHEAQSTAYVYRVMEYKKRNAKVDGIYEILKKFNVYPVVNQGHKGGYLEVVGNKTDVTIAHYVCDYLSHSIDNIWKQTKKENPQLKGMVAKNSFIRSFCQNIANSTNSIQPAEQKAGLIKLEQELMVKVELAYPNLRTAYSNARKSCSEASALGRNKAKSFNIPSALGSKIKKNLSLPWSK
jgi:hypothetical protein